MLSIVNRNDLTDEVLISNNEVNELKTLDLPHGWWHTTISHDLAKPKKLSILKLSNLEERKSNSYRSPELIHWDVTNGDYKINETYKKSFKVNPDYRKIINFASFSLTLVVTIAAVALILSQISKI